MKQFFPAQYYYPGYYPAYSGPHSNSQTPAYGRSYEQTYSPPASHPKKPAAAVTSQIDNRNDWPAQAATSALPTVEPWWFLAALIVLAVVYFQRLVEWHAIAVVRAREGIHHLLVWLEAAFSEWQRRRERDFYARMSNEQFRDNVNNLRTRVEGYAERSRILYKAADLIEAWHISFVMHVDFLRRRGAHYEDAAHHLLAEIARLEKLWREIEQSQAAQSRDQLRETVLLLMKRLGSTTDGRATKALAELNRLRSSFDWNSIVPPGVPLAARNRLIKILQLMAGTTSLAEARSALRQAEEIMNRKAA